MNTGKSKKFVMSYSCGKDSTLALHEMIQRQNEPIALIVMMNQDVNRSYFHGADSRMLKRYEEALQIPVLCAPTQGDDYHMAMERALREAKELGAEYACFGDIDIEENRAWCEERCKNTALKPVFPLWQNDRRQNVDDLIKEGYRCLIKSINNALLPKSLLGKFLDEETLQELSEQGIDVCGENGEYHTLAIDGPIFCHPVPYKTGRILDFGAYSAIEIE